MRGDTIPVVEHPGLVVRALRAPAAAGALPFAITVRAPDAEVPGPGLSLEEAARAVPGLQVHNRFNDALGDRVVVRGAGARSQFGIRGSQVVVDGIPATMPDGQATLNHVDLDLLERLELVRGPAAAAHGNAAGGVLLLSTRPPGGTGPEVGLRAGSHGLLRLAGAVGRGSSSAGGAGWRVTAARTTQDGFRPHAASTRSQLTGRAETPAGGGRLSLVGHAVAYEALNPGGLTPAQLAADPRQAQPFNVAQRTGEEGWHAQTGLRWVRALRALRVEAGVYGLLRDLRNPIPSAIIDLRRRAGGVRVLVTSSDPPAAGAAVSSRPAVPTSPLRWALGVDAAGQWDDRVNHDNEGGDRAGLTLDQAERVANMAVHGQALVPLGDRGALFLGGRYDRIAFAARDRVVTTDDPDDSGRRTMDALSPAAGLRLRLAPALSLAANVATAFETPTTTELVNRPEAAGGFNPALDPQRTVSYEAGATLTPGRRLELEAVVYQADVIDALVPFEVASAPGRQYFRNAGGARHRGLELAGRLRATPLDVTVAYSRVDARFTEYRVADAVHDGRRVPGVLPWTVEARLLGRPGGAWRLRLDYRRAGAMPATDANDAVAPGYDLLSLGLEHRRDLGPLALELHAGADNVLDAAYVASVVPNAFGDRYFEPGPGRTIHVGVRAVWR